MQLPSRVLLDGGAGSRWGRAGRATASIVDEPSISSSARARRTTRRCRSQLPPEGHRPARIISSRTSSAILIHAGAEPCRRHRRSCGAPAGDCVVPRWSRSCANSTCSTSASSRRKFDGTSSRVSTSRAGRSIRRRPNLAAGVMGYQQVPTAKPFRYGTGTELAPPYPATQREQTNECSVTKRVTTTPEIDCAVNDDARTVSRSSQRPARHRMTWSRSRTPRVGSGRSGTSRRRQRLHGADRRRVRHRQGSAGSFHPSPFDSRHQSLRGGELRGDSGKHARSHSVRLREAARSRARTRATPASSSRRRAARCCWMK